MSRDRNTTPPSALSPGERPVYRPVGEGGWLEFVGKAIKLAPQPKPEDNPNN
jgi:hypothetical protein